MDPLEIKIGNAISTIKKMYGNKNPPEGSKASEFLQALTTSHIIWCTKPDEYRPIMEVLLNEFDAAIALTLLSSE